jgi:predicted RNase H-like HicB family nuclease
VKMARQGASPYRASLGIGDTLSFSLSILPLWRNLRCMNMTFTAVFRRFPEGYAAFVEELPGANTQGATLEEARANLVEAATLVLEANRQLAEEELRGQDVIREPLLLGAA